MQVMMSQVVTSHLKPRQTYMGMREQTLFPLCRLIENYGSLIRGIPEVGDLSELVADDEPA
jgi:hypothetical protein